MKRRTVTIGTAAGLALAGLGGYGIASAGQGETGATARSPVASAHHSMMAAGKDGKGTERMHGSMMDGAEMRRMHRSTLGDPGSRRAHRRAMRSPEMRAMHREMHGRGR